MALLYNVVHRSDKKKEDKKKSAKPISTEVQNRAISVRQPYAEMIMRGIKTIEYRSIVTHVRGRVYVYASLTPGHPDDFADLNLSPGSLPVGVLIGTIEITDCNGEPGDYEWELENPERLPEPIKPECHPQPVWFKPFLLKENSSSK